MHLPVHHALLNVAIIAFGFEEQLVTEVTRWRQEEELQSKTSAITSSRHTQHLK